MGAACKACASGNSTIDRNTQNRDTGTSNVQDDELGENTKPEVNEQKENINQEKSDGSYNSNEQVDPNSGANEDEKQGLSELNTSVNQSDDPLTSKTDLPQNYEPNTGVEEIDDNQDEDELIVPLKSHVEVEDMSEKTLNGNLSAMRQYMSHLESTMNLDTEENISETCKNFLTDYLTKFEEVNNNSDFSSEDRKNARATIREEAVSQWREQNKDIDDNVLEQQVQFISKGLEDEFYDVTFTSSVRPNINENDDEKLEVEKPEETPNIVTDDDYDNNDDNQEETTNNDNNDDNKDNSDPQEPENPQSNEEIKENNENTENPPEENYENPPPEENTEEPPQENNEENEPTEENNEEPPSEPPQEENNYNEEPPPQENNEENVDEAPPTDDKLNEEPQNEENNYETGTVEPPKDENVEPQNDEPEPEPVEE